MADNLICSFGGEPGAFCSDDSRLIDTAVDLCSFSRDFVRLSPR